MTRRHLLTGLLTTGLGHAEISGADRGTGDFARRIFVRINELRVLSGSGELAWSDALTRCAVEQSVRKDRLRFLGHNDPERGGVSDRLNAAGLMWERCGENLFQERGYDDPVHFAVVNWWYSPGHKENLLGPEYTETGLGVAMGADGTYFVTQIFMRPISKNPGRRATR